MITDHDTGVDDFIPIDDVDGVTGPVYGDGSSLDDIYFIWIEDVNGRHRSGVLREAQALKRRQRSDSEVLEVRVCGCATVP